MKRILMSLEPRRILFSFMSTLKQATNHINIQTHSIILRNVNLSEIKSSNNFLYIANKNMKNIPLKQRDENVYIRGSSKDKIQYTSSSTHCQVSNYIAKHYQVPKKERCVTNNTNCNNSVSSVPRNTESLHKRSKSQNSQYIIQK